VIEVAINALVMLIVTVGPVEVAPIFIALTAHFPAQARRRLAVTATLTASGILLAFGLGGGALLQGLGIGMAAFRISGGILLLLLAVDLIFARQSGLSSITPGEEREAKHEHHIAVFPLGIPLLAGPGAIAAIVLLMDKAGGRIEWQVATLGALAAVMVLTLGILLAAQRLTAVLGVTGINVITRVAGILLSALAVQFILDGLKAAGVVDG
jgi:multiple antibiotic resistance protein